METIEIFSREEFAAIRTQWLAHLGPERKNSTFAQHMLMYALIKGKNPNKVFSPIANPIRLERVGREHGGGPWYSMDTAMRNLKHHLDFIMKIREAKAISVATSEYLRKKSSDYHFVLHPIKLTDAQIKYLISKLV